MSLLRSLALKMTRPSNLIGMKRLIHITPVSHVRKFKEYTEGDITIVEAEKITTPSSQVTIEPPDEAKKSTACAICKLGMKRLLYTDVLILSQFVDKNWNLMAIEDTSLCLKSYMQVKRLVEIAQKCKLMPRPANYQVYGLWDRCNTYHEWPPRKRDQAMKVVKEEFWEKQR